MMKYLLQAIFLVFPAVALAQESPPTALGAPITTIAGFYTLACHTVNWVFSFVMIAAVFALIFAGLRFMTAAGSEEGIASARRYLVYALAGVVVAILARSLILTTSDFIGADISSSLSCF